MTPQVKKFSRGLLSAALGLVVVAAGLLLGGLWQDLEAVGTGDPMQNYFSHEMPRQPGAAEAPLGRELSFNGMPMEVSFYQTEKDVVTVRDFYLREFGRMKLQTSVTEGADGAVVYGNDEKAKIQRIVSIQRRGEGTFVFPAIVPLFGIPSAAPPAASDLAVMEGAVGYGDVTAADYGRRSRIVTWQHAAPEGEVATAVRARMKALGWREYIEGVSAGTEIRFSREGREATYTITRSIDSRLTSVLTTVVGE